MKRNYRSIKKANIAIISIMAMIQLFAITTLNYVYGFDLFNLSLVNVLSLIAIVPSVVCYMFFIFIAKKQLGKNKSYHLHLSQKDFDAYGESARMMIIGEIASRYAHEINNPLMIIKAYLNQHLRNYKKEALTPENVKKFEQKVDLNIDKIANIVTSLSIFSRGGSGDRFQDLRIGTIIKDSINFVEQKFKSKKVNIRIKEDFFRQLVHCQYVELCQAIINVLSISCDEAMELNNSKVHVSVRKLRKNVMIIFSYEGHLKEEKNRLHQFLSRFYVTSNTHFGKGLNYTLADEIIRSHEGKIYYKKVNGNGQYCIEIPFVDEKSRCPEEVEESTKKLAA